MAFAQSSLHFEIQNLRNALAASQKQADKYAHLIASLSYELDSLRKNMCYSCKKKLGSINASVPPITSSAGQSPRGTATSVSAPLWRRVFQGRHHSHPTTDNAPFVGLSNSPALPPNTNTTSLPVPSELEVASSRSSSQTTPTPTHSGLDITSSEQKNKPLKWSVVYNPEVKRALELYLAHTFAYDSPVWSVKMSPDGRKLAVGTRGKTYLYELHTGSYICAFVDRYVKDRIGIWNVQFSPNGQLLATGASDNQIRIWDITIRRMRVMFKGHKSGVNNIDFSPDCHSLVSASDDKTVRIWNIRDGSSMVLPVTGSPSYFISVVFSPDGRYVAAGNVGKSLWIWDSRTHRLVAKWWGHTSGVWCIKFTPDGNGLISGGSDRTVKFWDISLLGDLQGVASGTVVNEEQCFPLLRSFSGHDNDIRSTAFFPDNARWIVTGSDDQSVRIWDTQSGVCQLTLQGHMSWVRDVDVSRSQNFLVTAGHDGYVMVWKYTPL